MSYKYLAPIFFSFTIWTLKVILSRLEIFWVSSFIKNVSPFLFDDFYWVLWLLCPTKINFHLEQQKLRSKFFFCSQAHLEVVETLAIFHQRIDKLMLLLLLQLPDIFRTAFVQKNRKENGKRGVKAFFESKLCYKEALLGGQHSIRASHPAGLGSSLGISKILFLDFVEIYRPQCTA